MFNIIGYKVTITFIYVCQLLLLGFKICFAKKFVYTISEWFEIVLEVYKKNDDYTRDIVAQIEQNIPIVLFQQKKKKVMYIIVKNTVCLLENGSLQQML